MQNYDEIITQLKLKIKQGDSNESMLEFLKEKNMDESENEQMITNAYSQIKEEQEKEKELGFWSESIEEKQERERNREAVYKEVQRKKQVRIDELRLSQNLPMAIIAGLIVSLLVAVLWAFVSMGLGFQHSGFGFLAGLIVGLSILKFGKGVDIIFGILGAIFSVWACLLGNTFTILAFVSKELDVSIFYAFSKINAGLFFELIKESLKPFDMLLYLISAYIGFSFSRLRVK
jgi:hypothetical protein